MSAESEVPPEQPVKRWIGPRETDIQTMLSFLGMESLEELAQAVIPEAIRRTHPMNLPEPLTEAQALERLRVMGRKNRLLRSLLGLSYHDCITPPPIQRHVLENPGWYTPYTPYQSELSQGRLECLFYFQTMVAELTGMEIANASLLDGGTAAAEGMMLCARRVATPQRRRFLIADHCHPHEIEVVQARAEAAGFEVEVRPLDQLQATERDFGIWLAYPDTEGRVRDLRPWIEQAHQAGALAVVSTDLLALTLLEPPGRMGADVVVGNSQRFGQPLGFGGPHAAFFATRDAFKRQMPGRLVGLSRDRRDRPAYRLALAAREQHIRREKATSNICTAQALMAVVAALYAIYHGPHGLRALAERIHRLALLLAEGLRRLGYSISPEPFFDTVVAQVPEPHRVDPLLDRARQAGFNLRQLDAKRLLIALDERSNEAEVQTLLEALRLNSDPAPATSELQALVQENLPEPLRRPIDFLAQPVFNQYQSETAFMRFLHRLESRDYSLRTGMIPLGSCTMKLTPSAAMFPLSWPEWSRIHPFVPEDQAAGFFELMKDLQDWLCAVTEMDAVCLQPNAGSQGEYTGLLLIRKYHQSRGEAHRRICLIPASAHGTNPASAAMSGMQVVQIACDQRGNIDVEDLKAKLQSHGPNVAAIMITYPSTHGVFEERIREIIDLVHQAGGLVYLDGANLNAMMGLVSPGELGADVCHMNLHKTFAMPHGGGGPGVGPIAVKSHLIPFLPAHHFTGKRSSDSIGPIAASPWGSPWILPISWVYIACLGAEGLRRTSLVALLNANYVSRRLAPYFPTVYTNEKGFVGHECILDLRKLPGVTAEDVAKRLMDYGFHAPTLSWPVPNTLMFEPTESEPLEELDRFCRAMEAIHQEIMEIAQGVADPQRNLLKNAPHPAEELAEDPWPHPYPRSRAAYPLEDLRQWKFWPACSRVDNVYGDRHPICRC